jgi:phytoene dehydrogenase-like protein
MRIATPEALGRTDRQRTNFWHAPPPELADDLQLLSRDRNVTDVDVVVVGSGPNGLAAALTLAQAGRSVAVMEGADTAGGGCRTEELTLPGFRHDVCAAVHPLLLASPFFRQPRFESLRTAFRHPEIPFANPLEGGRAAVVQRSLDATVEGLGGDGPTYRRLVGPLVAEADGLAAGALAPLRSIPSHPVAMARFGVLGLLPARILAGRFHGDEARALLAGVAAHSMLPLSAPLSGAFGLFLAVTAHAVGWPVVEGGSATIARTMVEQLTAAGGSVTTGRWVTALGELPSSKAVVFDTSPAGLLAVAGDRLPDRYRRSLQRFRFGPGVCKVDWALSGPVPWAAEACRRTVTVHVGGTLAEVARSEAAVHAGRHPERPYCIVVQPGVADPGRAPEGSATLWAYCHVPAGSTVDMADAVEAQIERFAPGFRDLVIARSVRIAAEVARHNPNYVGGDIAGGLASVRQTIFRPSVGWNPYRTALKHVYLCSSSTPPGSGVHGMCGFYAARTVLHDHFGGPSPLRGWARDPDGSPAPAPADAK